jgi:hypothetical protein
MASAFPEDTPNPNAKKFTLDIKLASTMNYKTPEDAASNAFAKAVFEVDGVVQVFGVNNFVTVSRRPGADWDPIVDAVKKAAAEHL